MDVQDAELLALAGGDSSDEEDTKPTITDGQSPLPSIEISQPNSSVNESSSRLSNKRGKNSRDIRKSYQNDTEEEGEA